MSGPLIAVTARVVAAAALTACSGSTAPAESSSSEEGAGDGFGLVKDGLPFVRTTKGGWAKRGSDFPAFWESLISVLLVAGATLLFATNFEGVREINLFAVVLVVQALPFLASAVLAGVSYAVWKGLDDALGRDLWAQIVSMTVALAAGGGIYAAGVTAMRVPEAHQIWNLFRRSG